MNAHSLLEDIAHAFDVARLEVIMIGNAAAALQGAPVTTDDFDFMFRPTRTNIAKLKYVTELLCASLSQPEYPASLLYRISNPKAGLQIDMMGVVDGVKSFESLRSRAERVGLGGSLLCVASLNDVIKSKRAAGREKDKASLPVLEATLKLKRKP